MLYYCYANYRHENNEDQDFNTAIRLAQHKGINVAYSNDAFELWFILHLNFTDTALTRHEYYESLSKFFGFNYEKFGKEKDFAKSIYKILQEYQPKAIQNAERLHLKHGDDNFCKHNPCTTVYQLVLELNKCLKK
ncbi:MAG: RloB domain-containing protein [Flavobacterium sp.]|nr:MAG: RloB domain-containing protein [Flavobacterium sp.]